MSTLTAPSSSSGHDGFTPASKPKADLNKMVIASLQGKISEWKGRADYIDETISIINQRILTPAFQEKPYKDIYKWYQEANLEIKQMQSLGRPTLDNYYPNLEACRILQLQPGMFTYDMLNLDAVKQAISMLGERKEKYLAIANLFVEFLSIPEFVNEPLSYLDKWVNAIPRFYTTTKAEDKVIEFYLSFEKQL
jgi:hypothetical protein